MKRPQALWTRIVILQQSPLVFLSQQAVIISMLVVLIVGPQNPNQRPSDNAVFSEDQPSTLVLLQLVCSVPGVCSPNLAAVINDSAGLSLRICQ